jgi:hypothetical protein
MSIMNNKPNENLRQLLAGFMDETAARQMAEDIEKGEEILGAYSVPQPDERVLAEVKKNVVSAVRRQHTAVLQKRILSAAVAAALILVSLLAMIRFSNQHVVQQTPLIASGVWEGSDDADVTVLRAEIENIQHELSGAQSDSISTGGANSAIGELETEIIELGGDIWKG